MCHLVYCSTVSCTLFIFPFIFLTSLLVSPTPMAGDSEGSCVFDGAARCGAIGRRLVTMGFVDDANALLLPRIRSVIGVVTNELL